MGDILAAERWLRHGGDATLSSWGVAEDVIANAPTRLLIEEARHHVSPDVVDWLESLALYFRSRDVVFVHAGIRPGVPLRKQSPVDLMWISQEFTDNDIAHPFMVVHGHTIVEDGPVFRPYRIGIDTGAFHTGRLSALGLEGDKIWPLAVERQNTQAVPRF